ncbi:hypothetical protein COBT_002585 [Conglomerata obtusa]
MEQMLQIDIDYNFIPKTASKEKLIHLRNQNFSKYAIKNLQKGKIQNKLSFDVGDKVSVYNSNITAKNFSSWEQDFVISERNHENAYLVVKEGKSYRFSKNFIQKEVERGKKNAMANK